MLKNKILYFYMLILGGMCIFSPIKADSMDEDKTLKLLYDCESSSDLMLLDIGVSVRTAHTVLGKSRKISLKHTYRVYADLEYYYFIDTFVGIPKTDDKIRRKAVKVSRNKKMIVPDYIVKNLEQNRLPINSKLDSLSITLEMSRNAKINLYEAYSRAREKSPKDYIITRVFSVREKYYFFTKTKLKKEGGEVVFKRGVYVDSETGEAKFFDLDEGIFEWSPYKSGYIEGYLQGQLDFVIQMYRKNKPREQSSNPSNGAANTTTPSSASPTTTSATTTLMWEIG